MLTLIFYETARGEAPVRDFLENLDPKVQAKLVTTIERLMHQGTNLGRPEVAKLKGRIWELRALFGGMQYRILFAELDKKSIILLSHFVKKTDKVPQREIDTATKRLEEFESRSDEEREEQK